MEINQEILYIIGGIIYFIYTVWQNIRKKPVTLEEEEENPEAETKQPQRKHRRETVTKPFDERVGHPVPRQPSSFEELLQEFERASQKAEGKAEEKVKKLQEADDEYEPIYDEQEYHRAELEAERQIRETEARKVLQEKASAKDRAVVVEKEVRKKIDKNSLSGRAKVPSGGAPVKEQEHRKYSQPANKRREQVLAMLKNPDSVTNTILASEILNRKYF